MNMLSLMDFRCVLQEITAMNNHLPLGTIKDSKILMPSMLLLGSPIANVPLGHQQYVKDIISTWWT